MKYNSQALAIVLVLLLVGTVIGFALYARSIRESERLVGERASAEANELVETVIGLVGMSRFSKLVDDRVLLELDCDETSLNTSDGCRRSNISIPELTDLLILITGRDSVELDEFDRDLVDYCNTEIMMRYGMETDEVIIERDDVFSLSFSGVTDWSSPGGCTANFQLQPVEGDQFGFIKGRLYRSPSGGHKSYELSDTLGFRYGGGGNNWIGYEALDDLSFPSDYPGVIGGSLLDEIRFTAVGGASALTWELNNCEVENYLVMEVGATCHGRYVGKRFNVPGELFSPSIFDYVLFNGAGELRPEEIRR